MTFIRTLKARYHAWRFRVLFKDIVLMEDICRRNGRSLNLAVIRLAKRRLRYHFERLEP